MRSLVISRELIIAHKISTVQSQLILVLTSTSKNIRFFSELCAIYDRQEDELVSLLLPRTML